MLLKLVFKNSQLEFVEVVGDIADRNIIRSVRGRNLPLGYETSFLWNNGLRALTSLLLLEYLARRSSPPEPIPSIRGGTGSFASTLDHALDRNTSWTRDIFGSDKEGSSLLKRFILRLNARRRRHQEVEVTLRPEARKRLTIEVLSSDSKQLTDAEVLEIIKRLDPTKNCENDVSVATTHRESEVTNPSINNEELKNRESIIVASVDRNTQLTIETSSKDSPNSSETVNSLKLGFKKEALDVLLRPEALNSMLSIDEIRTAIGHVRFQHTVGARNQTEIGQLLCSGELNSQHFGDQPPSHCHGVIDGLGLRFALSPMLIGSISILNYLRCVRSFNLNLDYQYSHTIDIANDILAHRLTADACVVTTASLAKLYTSEQSGEFIPILMMPKVSHRLVAPSSAITNISTKQNLEFGFFRDITSSVWFFYESLREFGKINPHSATAEMSVDDISRRLIEKDRSFRALRAFPFFLGDEIIRGCQTFGGDQNNTSWGATVLLLHKRHAANPAVRDSLIYLIRYGWQQLFGKSSLVSLLVEMVFEDPVFLHQLIKSMNISCSLFGRVNSTPNSFVIGRAN